MALEYGVFIVDGLEVTKQTLSLTGQSTGFTDAEGFTGDSEHLVPALTRVGNAGWSLVASFPNNVNQTYMLVFTRQK